MIRPGGQGLKRDRGASDDDDDDDEDDDDEMDLDGLSELDGSLDLDSDDASEVDEDDNASQDDAEVDLSEDDSDRHSDKEGQSDDDADEEDGSTQPEPAQTATKYVPPHMRAAQLAEKAKGSKEKVVERQKLERKTQGLLNK